MISQLVIKAKGRLGTREWVDSARYCLEGRGCSASGVTCLSVCLATWNARRVQSVVLSGRAAVALGPRPPPTDRLQQRPSSNHLRMPVFSELPYCALHFFMRDLWHKCTLNFTQWRIRHPILHVQGTLSTKNIFRKGFVVFYLCFVFL